MVNIADQDNGEKSRQKKDKHSVGKLATHNKFCNPPKISTILQLDQ